MVSPLTQLTRKDKPFSWTEQCEACFEEMKKRLTTTPVLAIPDTTQAFEVYCDASYQGLGCVLMQEKGGSVCFSTVEDPREELSHP